jgi:hypothetical protein
MSADNLFHRDFRRSNHNEKSEVRLSIAGRFVDFVYVAFDSLTFSACPKNGVGGGNNSPIKYPETKKVETVNDYFGTKVPDPYRWLEDDRSPEVAAWVEAQNKVTYAYLDQIPIALRSKIA